jgi:SAM-dependent methyltransferase
MTSAARSTAPRTKVFVRDDGVPLRIVDGFRERVRSAPRESVQPKPGWTLADYEAAADKKLRQSRSLLADLERWGGSLEAASVLELGCGAGIDSLLFALHPVDRVVGIDLDFPLAAHDEWGERARRLTSLVLERAGSDDGLEEILRRRPVRFLPMDATHMEFADASFDLVVSRATLEHVIPIEDALAEMARVVRPGGLLRHAIDPFFWLKGCHKRGVVDLPWAHARLDPGEFHRFVAEIEGASTAAKRSRHLETLNQLGLRQWRALFEAAPFEILDWFEQPSTFAQTLLGEHRDVPETLLEGVTERDLVHCSIKVWLRRR